MVAPSEPPHQKVKPRVRGTRAQRQRLSLGCGCQENVMGKEMIKCPGGRLSQIRRTIGLGHRLSGSCFRLKPREFRDLLKHRERQNKLVCVFKPEATFCFTGWTQPVGSSRAALTPIPHTCTFRSTTWRRQSLASRRRGRLETTKAW